MANNRKIILKINGEIIDQKTYARVYHLTYFDRSDVREREGRPPAIGVGEKRVEEIRKMIEDGSIAAYNTKIMQSWFVPTLADGWARRRDILEE